MPAPPGRRAELYAFLGDLPARDRPVSARVVAHETRPAYTLEVLELDVNGIEPVPAYFTRPHGLDAPAPAGLDRVEAALTQTYAQAGVPERWELVRYAAGHFETWDMRARIRTFLHQFLGAGPETLQSGK